MGPSTATQQPKISTWLYPLARRLHFYAGIFIAPFIIIAAITGGLYALSIPAEKIIYRHELTASSQDTRLTIDEQVAAANSYVGDANASPAAVRPAPQAGATTRVMYADENLGESETRGIFVDPATGEIRGDLTVYGSSGSLSVRAWISTFHTNLHLGKFGHVYSELAASWMWVVALGGVTLWILRAQKLTKKKDLVVPNNKIKGYRRTLSWHSSAGIWLALGMVFFSATGITWSTYAGENVKNLRTVMSWTTPSVNKSLDGSTISSDEHAHHHGSHTTHDAHTRQEPQEQAISYDRILQDARQEPTIDSRNIEIVPGADRTAWTVTETQRSFPTQVDSVAVNPQNDTIVDTVRFADYPLAAKLTRWGADTHMGIMFGAVNQLVIVIFSVALTMLCIWGYVMWWQRRPKNKSHRLGAVPPHTMWKNIPVWFWLPLTLVAVAIGLFLPLLGISLVLFLALDTVFIYRKKQTQ